MAKLTFLGAGTPTPTQTRFGTSQVLDIGEDSILIDCGPATTYRMAQMGIAPTAIEHLFFTHHHSDHNSDYPCFLTCRWDQTTPAHATLQVWGPKPTERITKQLVGPDSIFIDDQNARVGCPVSQIVHKNRGGELPRPRPEVEAFDVGPGDVTEQNGWRVKAVAVHHVEPFLLSLAYRFDSDEGSVVFAGDTDSVDVIGDFATGCDMLVANCWNLQEIMDGDGEAPGQTGTIDAANMAARSGAKKLVLTHMGPSIACAEGMAKATRDIKRIYDGEMIFAEELMVLDV